MEPLSSNGPLCPVCGFELWFEAWKGELPSDEICPSCGIQFGYYDATPEGAEGRKAIYTEWRNRWIDEGFPWNGVSQEPPEGWDPIEQLRILHGR